MRSAGEAPNKVKYGGQVIVGISATDPTKVMIEFHDPDWWMEMTPDEVRVFAGLLLNKAKLVEDDLAAAGGN